MPSPELVDDSDAALQYDIGWIWETPGSYETMHGATTTGLSVTLTFNGEFHFNYTRNLA